MMGNDLRFFVLGPIEVYRGGVAVRLGGVRQRTLLAALLLNLDRPVAVDRLVDVLWGDRPPDNCRGDLQANVSRLRRLLVGDGGRAGRCDRAGVIVHTAGSYRIPAVAGSLDLTEFDRLADAAAVGSQPELTARLLRRALRLWREPLLADVTPELADLVRPGLDERRLAAVHRCVTAELATGSEAPVGELQDLITQYPHHEELRGLLMRALAVAGRKPAAIVAYQEGRRWLADNLGVDPGRELQSLYQSILRDEPLMADPAAGTPRLVVTETSTPTAIPSQLPAAVPGFVARGGELAELDRLLDDTVAGGAPLVAVVSGTAGVGKTALVVQWAHQYLDRFPDGQLYVDLRGYGPGPPAPAAEVLAGLLYGLGVPIGDLPSDHSAREVTYRSVLARRKVLVVLDNAASAEQVRRLLPGTPSCLTLVTSRDRLVGLVARDGARRIELNVLPLADACELLGILIGAGRAAEDPAALEDLAYRCARLPLALRVAAELVAAQPGRALGDLVAEFDRRSLDWLAITSDEHSSVRSVLSWSYQRLAPDAASLFRLLGLHPGPDYTARAAAALAGMDRDRAGRLLDELVHAHLLNRHGDRLRMHDLLRAFANERAQTDDDHATRGAALTRLHDWYLRTAIAATHVLYPFERGQRGVPSSGDVPAMTIEQANAWLACENDNMVSVAHHAADIDQVAKSGDLAVVLARHLYTTGAHDIALSLHDLAAAACRRSGDRRGEGCALIEAGRALWRLGRYPQARERLNTALEITRSVGDRGGEGTALLNTGIVYRRLGRYDDALHSYQQALAIARELGERLDEGRALANIGTLYSILGRNDEATDYLQQDLAIAQEVGDRPGEGITWGTIGDIYWRSHRYDEALGAYRQCLDIACEVGNRNSQARALANLGDTYRCLGRYPEALDHLTQALYIAQPIGDRDSITGIHVILGQTHQHQAEHERAVEHLTQALTMARDAGDAAQQATILNALGESSRAVGHLDRALAQHHAALNLAQTHGYPKQIIDAHTGLARTHDDLGRPEKADHHRWLANQAQVTRPT